MAVFRKLLILLLITGLALLADNSKGTGLSQIKIIHVIKFFIAKKVLIFYHLKTRHCVNTVHM